jgi:hypothetical protein
MCNGVLGFLDRTSVSRFMAVGEFSQVCCLHRCFCKAHGTRLGQVWVPTGPQKECTDCEMAKIGRIRCGKCDDFSKWNHFSNCHVCDKSECNECKCTVQCSECQEEFCNECKDYFYCGACGMESCFECKDDWLPCDQCENEYCLDCKDMFICTECDKAFCHDCKYSFYCSKCESIAILPGVQRFFLL